MKTTITITNAKVEIEGDDGFAATMKRIFNAFEPVTITSCDRPEVPDVRLPGKKKKMPKAGDRLAK
jgi:hypothetical protein